MHSISDISLPCLEDPYVGCFMCHCNYLFVLAYSVQDKLMIHSDVESETGAFCWSVHAHMVPVFLTCVWPENVPSVPSKIKTCACFSSPSCLERQPYPLSPRGT